MIPAGLEEIVAAGRRRIDALRPGAAMLEEAAASACLHPCRDLVAALGCSDRIPVIAEVKRRSPSGCFAARETDAGARAACYEKAGAAAVSILTEERFFGGCIGDVTHSRAFTGLPILRKDFVVDRLQILESRLAGADAVLLIAAILPGKALGEMYGACTALGMTPLVEVHGERELERALRHDPRLVGINNRDLGTMRIDLSTTERLAPLVPCGITRVSESGIGTVEDIRRLISAGADAFLVGSALMAAGDPGGLLARMTGLGRQG